MKKIKIGLIGFGNRGRLYSSFIKDLSDKVEYEAVCDVRIDDLLDSIKPYGVKHTFKDVEDFFDAKLDLDLVCICSMDKYHFYQTKKCLEMGYNVLLEKPVSNNLKEVEELNKLASKKNLKLIVSYVLRYTLFYKMIKDIIDSGEIGKVININNTENVAYWHHAHSYTRGNWKYEKETGPMILTKCSHDMDLIYWLMGKNVDKISSFGNRSYLIKENAPKNAAEYCIDCIEKDNCPFNAYRFYLNNKEWLRPIIGDDLSDENIMKNLYHNQYTRCAYKTNADVVDHQVVNILFDDKTTASHTMNAYTRYCYRDIKVMGSHGCIEGNFEEKKFKVYHFKDNSEREVDITHFTDDFVGHGGGDRVMFIELIDYLLTGNKTKSLTSISESVISHEMAFAAEKSRVNEGKVVKIKYKI